MGLICSIIAVPLAPMKRLIRLAGLLRDRVAQPLHDPITGRSELERIAQAAAAGALSQEEKRAAQQQVIHRMRHPEP
ncbi:gas vesicle protein G [Nocardia amamiensis]|uniref:Gas vesicle protein G n=1 Tax=Nocardia amamiensis TaxID=404578 RepID=A0ABS0D6Y8_9NOCA|nr:gas vesicle protein G [Nocardia amamiensis]MBF6302893.1 gas vesicle protein G [Nocardia amamiensis]